MSANRERLQTIFQSLDINGDHVLDNAELREAFRKSSPNQVPSLAEVQAMIQEIDRDGVRPKIITIINISTIYRFIVVKPLERIRMFRKICLSIPLMARKKYWYTSYWSSSLGLQLINKLTGWQSEFWRILRYGGAGRKQLSQSIIVLSLIQ